MKKTTPYARKCARRQADPSAIYRVMSRVQPFVPDELAQLNVPVMAAFERMRTGCADDGDFDTLASAVNICMVRGEEIDPLCVETAQRAQDALMRTMHRHKTTGRWGFDGPALQDIPVAMDLYRQMLELSTPMQMQSAMRATVQRMNKGQTL